MSVNWAHELGIDLRALKEESFLHPRRVGEQRAHRDKATEYWSTRWATTNLQVSVEEDKLDRDGQSNL
jgi:hypothetical protein